MIKQIWILVFISWVDYKYTLSWVIWIILPPFWWVISTSSYVYTLIAGSQTWCASFGHFQLWQTLPDFLVFGRLEMNLILLIFPFSICQWLSLILYSSWSLFLVILIPISSLWHYLPHPYPSYKTLGRGEYADRQNLTPRLKFKAKVNRAPASEVSHVIWNCCHF